MDLEAIKARWTETVPYTGMQHPPGLTFKHVTMQNALPLALTDIPALIAEVERLRGLLAIAAKSYANTISSEWHDMTPEEAMAEWEQATDQR